MTRNAHETRGWSLADKLEHYTAARDKNGCRIWIGAATGRPRNYYGVLWWAGRYRRAHVLVLEKKLGRPLRKGMWGLHNCPAGDNPLCVAMEHLWEGSPRDNVRDMHAKGRAVSPVGQRNGHAVLTDGQVYAVRAAKGSLQAIADRFNISDVHVYKIKNYLLWSHLPKRPEDVPADWRAEGGLHGCSHLSTEQVLAVRADTRSQIKIAADYGISQPAVGAIKRRKTYSHIPEPR